MLFASKLIAAEYRLERHGGTLEAIVDGRLFATWTSIGGMLYNFSDWLPDLSEDRIDVLKRTMAPHGVKTVRPIDFFERTLANAWVLEKGETRIFGLYNWATNETLRIDYPAAYAGLRRA